MRKEHKRPLWAGGYIRKGKKRDVYIIEKWMGGIHFHVSTRCSTEEKAIAQLRRFEADPVGYEPVVQSDRPVTLTADLVIEYATWMVRKKRVTQAWANDVERYLNDWIEDLDGGRRKKDLRKLSIQKDVKPALARRQTSEKHRIEALKAFMSWMRREKGLIKHSEDPTLDLPVPQDRPAQQRRRRAAPADAVQAVMPHLPEEGRDVLVLLSGTGWHLNEVRRFAADGEILEHHQYLAVLTTLHKSGDTHHTAIQHQEHLDAARRIRARGAIPSNSTLAAWMETACAKAGVTQFRMGVMRHTVGTAAVKAGASIAEVSKFLGHRSEATTRRFYIDAGQTVQPVPTIRHNKG